MSKITISGSSKSDKNVFNKIQRYINLLPDRIEKGVTAVVIREVDRYALEFYQRVKRDTPYLKLQGTIKLKKVFKRGIYGYRLLFDGYVRDKEGNLTNTPLQMIANVLNSGRVAGEGTAKSGRNYAFGKIEGIKFMTNNLELLGNINPAISNATDLMQWIVTEDYIILSDGTHLTTAELENYMRKEEG